MAAAPRLARALVVSGEYSGLQGGLSARCMMVTRASLMVRILCQLNVIPTGLVIRQPAQLRSQKAAQFI